MLARSSTRAFGRSSTASPTTTAATASTRSCTAAPPPTTPARTTTSGPGPTATETSSPAEGATRTRRTSQSDSSASSFVFSRFFIVRMQNKASKSWVQWWRNAFRSSLWRNKGQKGEKEMSLMKASSYKVRSGRNVVFTCSSQDRITVFHSLRQQASRSQKNHTIRSN